METRERLLACALEELESSGLHKFSLRAVGAAAGLSPMAVYRHFENKDDLLRAVGEEAFEAWKRRIDGIKEPRLEKWFREVTRAYIEFALDEPAKFDACFVLKTNVERIYPDDFRVGKSPVISLTVQRVESAQARGLIKKGDALEMTMFVWSQLHGLVMLHRAGRFALARAPFLKLCERCSQHALDGLRNRDP
jgi:AcrR family transcriptional regulator